MKTPTDAPHAWEPRPVAGVLPPRRICVLISGNGSNLQAILEAAQAHRLGVPARVVLVLSNRRDAYGLERARLAGVESRVLLWDKSLHTREAYERALAEAVCGAMPDVVVMAGFMHIVGEEFLARVRLGACSVINLHPALPDAYVGANAIEQGFAQWQSGARVQHGVMVHHVTTQLDRGEVITTERIAPNPQDSLESFTQKMHAAERAALLRALQSLLQASAPAHGFSSNPATSFQ